MEYQLFIGGAFRDGVGVKEVRVPYDGRPFASVQIGDVRLLDEAVAAARRGFAAMRGLTRARRADILLDVRRRLLEDAETMATIIASECGKPLREARVEVTRGASTLLFSAQEALALAGEEVPMDASAHGAGRMAMVIREPLGVIGAITPFNFPLNLSLHKIGPALAGGNAVVHKPASATPVSALRLARYFAEAGLPEGALNVVPGPGAELGEALARHPDVAMVTFTGSPAVGVRLREIAGLKRVTLELGSNSAVIVERDADLELAVPLCVSGAYSHSGQVCISVQRIFVHESLMGSFVERMTAGAAALRPGDPADEATEVSSLITEGEAERVSGWVAEAVGAGARLVSGGERSGSRMTPAVVTGVPESAKLFTQEAFGPVAAVNSFGELDEAIRMVNASEFGLQASIFTRDLQRAFRAARETEVGGFLINDVPQFRADQMPYGGVKLSGTGREGPRYAMEEMTERKLIVWRV
ncbi:MAG TPA: aldehyde dehydrogenase family protein [Bryobacteraceae bacterium]|nr:aldehyde dehydrogenase family protein [Bryobacteraceae bacterium]